MELLALLLSGLFAVVSPVGWVGETLAEDAIASQLETVEGIRVRIDAVPLHSVARGRVQSIRIALRGGSVAPLVAYPDVNLRIDRLELETEIVDLDWERLQDEGLAALRHPANVGVRLVLQREDLNATLRSIAHRFSTADYAFIDPQLVFLDRDRVRFQIEVREDEDDRALIIVETGVKIIWGRQIELLDPIVRVEGEDAPDRILDDLSSGLNEQLDLAQLEKRGLFIRIVRFHLHGDRVEIAAIIRLDPNGV